MSEHLPRSARMLVFVLVCVAFGAMSGACLAQGQGGPIRGAGATFPFPVYAAWITEYRRTTGREVVYEPVGSGMGRERIANGSVDFGASDIPLSDAELQHGSLMQFPAVIGAVVPVINITGVKPGQLKMDGKVLGDIYLGKVRKWNDPAIAALNPDLPLPNANITVVHRADASGTTHLWSDYLSRSNPAWKAAVGTGDLLAWPRGVAEAGNEGVASSVKRTRMSLGYVEYAYAVAHGLSAVSLRNRAGLYVAPGRASIDAVLADSSWERATDLNQPIVDQGGPQSWPIAGASFIMVPTAPASLVRSIEVIDFFEWALTKGRSIASDLSYAPMPPTAVDLTAREWSRHFK